MKNLFTLLSVIICISAGAQEKKVEVIETLAYCDVSNNEETFESNYCDIISCGVSIVHVPVDYNLPFKIYEVSSNTKNWNTTQDVFNSIRAKVPNLSISASNNGTATPKITMRGDDNTIVIIDGIRYNDASILNTINPNDIETVYVAPSVAASNYLRNNPNFLNNN